MVSIYKFGKNELLLLCNFRQNAKSNLTTLSKKTGMPVSTIFEKVKRYEKNLITKYTVLLDYNILGYNLKVQMFLKVNRQKKDEIKKRIMNNHKVNNFYRITNGYDFFIEAIFKDMNDLEEFNDFLESIGVIKKIEFYILEEMKKNNINDILMFEMKYYLNK